MDLPRTFNLRKPGRWTGGAFILFWLCGWGFSEAAVSQELLRHWKDPSLFLALWLALWTFGGFAALRSLVQLGASEARLELEGADLVVERTVFGFRWRTAIPRGAVRGARRKSNHAVVLELTGGSTRELFQARDEGEAQAAVEAICWALDKPVPAVEARLPARFAQTQQPGGQTVLEPSVSARRWAAALVGVVSAVIAALTVQHALAHDSAAAVLVPVAVLIAMWLIYLPWSRTRWVFQRGLALRERRWNGGVTVVDRFESPRVGVRKHTDSEGDVSYAVELFDRERSHTVSRSSDEDEMLALAAFLEAKLR